MSTPLVLFWDIDGTLLSTARAGVFAWEEGVRDAIGHDMSLQDYNTAGLTDVEISRLLVQEITGEDDRESAARVLQRYEELLPSRLHYRQGEVLPGVRELLEHTAGTDTLNLLLTGNTRAGASAKLTHYGLIEHFADGGAFADGTDDRPSIARNARAMVEQRLGDVPAERMHVIGDTPHDIHCGKAIGVRTVAVATGTYTSEQLGEHDPWWLLERLPAPVEFLARLER